MTDARMTPCTLPSGWSLWAYATTEARPYLYRQVDLMRREWSAPLRCDPWTLHPLMNVVDLFWRPVDEGRPTVAWREEADA